MKTVSMRRWRLLTASTVSMVRRRLLAIARTIAHFYLERKPRKGHELEPPVASQMLPKRLLAHCATVSLLAIVCLSMLGYDVHGARAAGEPPNYEKAKVELSRLRSDEKRAHYRHEWLRVADSFWDIYETNSGWGNRPAALFRSAEALEEMARRSFLPKDAQNAAVRYESLAKKHASSALADDALYRAAIVRNELLQDPKDAIVLLESIGKKFPKSDYAAKAKDALVKLDGRAVASLGKAEGALKAEKSDSVSTKVVGITPQKRENTVRIVIALDRSVSWTVKHQAADAKSPARLTLDLAGASPDKGLKFGERYSKMGIFTRYAVDYTASKGQTRILLDFSDLARYTVKLEKSPARLVIEATNSSKALRSGVKVDQKNTIASAKKPARANKSKATAPPNVAAQLGLTVKTVVIDAGHGGKDPGAIHNSIVEREICLDVAKRLGSALNAAGYQVVYTRERDSYISLADRSRIAMEKKGDLFISIHVNASTNNDKNGVETFYLDLAGTQETMRLATVENTGSGRRLGEMETILADLLLDARIQESRKLASAVQDGMLSKLKKSDYSAKNGGTRGAPFHVLLGSSMPGILVEVGYCSNLTEAKRLKQVKYRNALAEGIANGIHRYARQLETAGK